MKHYICTGSCEGESTKPGVCETTSCEKFEQPLTECNCEDGSHRGLKGSHIHQGSTEAESTKNQ